MGTVFWKSDIEEYLTIERPQAHIFNILPENVGFKIPLNRESTLFRCWRQSDFLRVQSKDNRWIDFHFADSKQLQHQNFLSLCDPNLLDLQNILPQVIINIIKAFLVLETSISAVGSCPMFQDWEIQHLTSTLTEEVAFSIANRYTIICDKFLSSFQTLQRLQTSILGTTTFLYEHKYGEVVLTEYKNGSRSFHVRYQERTQQFTFLCKCKVSYSCSNDATYYTYSNHAYHYESCLESETSTLERFFQVVQDFFSYVSLLTKIALF